MITMKDVLIAFTFVLAGTLPATAEGSDEDISAECVHANFLAIDQSQEELLVVCPLHISTKFQITDASFNPAPGCFHTRETDMRYTELDWDSIRTLEQLDACILQAAEEISNSDVFVKWLNENGFDVFGPHPVSLHIMKTSYNHEGEGVRLSGSIQRDDIKLSLGWLEMLGVDGLSVGVVMKLNGQPLHVRSSLSRT